MIFSSLDYLLFFPVVFVLYWSTSGTARKAILLVSSYIFYMSWMPVYGVLIFLMTAVNFLLGLLLEKHRQNRLLFGFSVLLNLGALIYYKYTNFLIASIFDALHLAKNLVPLNGVPNSTPVFEIILPLGISFFTFEFIHYIVDIRRGGPALKNPLDFALFTAFFPSQIAGPIKRYLQFDKELNEKKVLRRADVFDGCGQFIQGLVKKVALADNLAPITAHGINNVHSLSTGDAWALMVLFLLQLYFDFSGYTDMGIGSARMLGIHLPVNFAMPYVCSKNILEFWERWHISLSSWLKDYVFIPLGGSRCSKWMTNRNILLTFTVTGFWHGAAWHHVIWGFIHGILVVATREYLEVVKHSPRLTKFHAQQWTVPVAVLCTFIISAFAQTVFFAHTTADALTIFLRSIVPTDGSLGLVNQFIQSPALVSVSLYCLFGLLFVDIPWLPLKQTVPIRYFFASNPFRMAAGYVTAVVAAIAFSPALKTPFIYFQF